MSLRLNIYGIPYISMVEKTNYGLQTSILHGYSSNSTQVVHEERHAVSFQAHALQLSLHRLSDYVSYMSEDISDRLHLRTKLNCQKGCAQTQNLTDAFS